MKQVHTIDDLAALKAMTDPLRKEIIRALQPEPRTTAQLAAILQEKPTKLHYHVTELERNGLIELVETRMKGNLQEKYYRSVAEMYRVDPRLFQEGPQALEAFYDNAVGLLDNAALDLRSAIQSGRITSQESARSVSSLLYLCLTPEEAEEFKRRLESLITEYGKKGRSGTEGGALLSLHFFPMTSLPEFTPPPGEDRPEDDENQH